jgi:two-component system sensor histidine kinase ArlS
MKIRNKILIYFSTTVIALLAISLTIIYILFSEFREEEFQQRQKEKITYTVSLWAQYKNISEELASMMDLLTIHDFYDEKMMVFDGQKDLIFSSIDDLPITNYSSILNQLSPDKQWIETKEEHYDIVGVYIENSQRNYYAISKAYDVFGYSKLAFLKNALLGIFAAITIAVILVSLFLSNKISKPINSLAAQLGIFDLATDDIQKIAVETSSHELQLLTERFNQLLQRTNEAFFFQKHSIHHISHQLKTPIAVLVSELEKLKNYTDIDLIKHNLGNQINKAKSLGGIINSLLEISKIESGQSIYKEHIRIDELIFDIIDELNSIYPEFKFEVNYHPNNIDENRLVVRASRMLLKQAFQNLLSNCISYSDDEKAEIKIDCSSQKELKIIIHNSGKPLSEEEQKYLFKHFFRGKNSLGKIGFGLGLVLTKKIIALNSGNILYFNPSENSNTFVINFSLS